MSGELRRKVAKRSFPLLPLLLNSIDGDGDGDILVPLAKKPRLEVPLVAIPTTEEVASRTKSTSPDVEALESEVELTTFRVVNPLPTIIQKKHTSGKKRRKGELSTLAAMVASI